MCTPTSEMQALAGEDCRSSSSGMFFINTNAVSPYANGRISETTSSAKTHQVFFNPISHIDPFTKEIDTFGKLEGNFNNLPFSPTTGDDYATFFVNHGSSQIAESFINTLRYNNERFKRNKMKIDNNYGGKVRWPNSRSSRYPRVNELLLD